jgi:hypothetical protein
MFKAATVAGLTCAENLVQDTQNDVNKEGTIDQKERNNTTRLGYGSRRRNMTRNRNRVNQKLAVCDGQG